MRFALAVLTLLLVVNLNAVAKDLTDWRRVQELRVGTELKVVDKFGNVVDGHVTSASPDEIKLNALVTNQPGLSTPAVFLRGDLREVYKLGKKYERRLGGKNLILASAVGMVGGIALGAALDHAYPNNEDPGQGKLVGGALGFFTGPAVLAIGRAVISGLHRTKLIYRAPPDRINGISRSDLSNLGQTSP